MWTHQRPVSYLRAIFCPERNSERRTQFSRDIASWIVQIKISTRRAVQKQIWVNRVLVRGPSKDLHEVLKQKDLHSQRFEAISSVFFLWAGWGYTS